MIASLGSALGYKKGSREGFDQGLTEGIQQGKAEARVLAKLMKHYGSFDNIPTAAIREGMPTMGMHVANQQLIKKACVRFMNMLDEIGMPPANNTVDLVIKFLENDPTISDEGCEQITAVLDNPTCFGGLVSLAEIIDHMDVELFMRLIRDPLPNPHLEEYHACLKNDYFTVQ